MKKSESMRKSKPAKVHELIAQAAVRPSHSSSMQLHISKQYTTTHLLRVNSLKQHSTICRQYRSIVSKHRETTVISSHCGYQHNLMHRYTSLTMRLTQKQALYHALYIYRSLFRDRKTGPPIAFINGYSDSQVNNQGSCIAVHLSRNQASQNAVFQVTDTRGYLIFGCETAQHIGYIFFPRIMHES